MAEEHDVIVVGARCAGAPTAMLLARAGHRVLLVDRATFPSDTLSTLVIHAPGVAALRRWGVLDEVVATGCPPIDRYSFDFGPLTIAGTARPAVDGGTTGYAPRRTVLDATLVRAADRAGAEVRERFTVTDVVVEDGAVVGVRGHGDGGAEVVERAKVVVGADGTHSRIARAVGADRYHEKPALQSIAYTYWSGFPVDGMETVVRPDRGWAAVPTNDGLTMLVVGWPTAEAAAYRADVEGNYLATLGLAPAFAARMRDATREARFAVGAVPNLYRRPFGPGWALVGDAGCTMDPITAQGMTDAFLDAERVAAALDAVLAGRRPFDDAMADAQLARDAATLPMYELTTQLATLAPPPPELQALLGALQGDPAEMDGFVSVIAGTVSPVEFFAPEHVGRLMAGA